MKITILSVGRIKEKYLSAGIDEYAKRLSRYCSLELIEVPDEKCPETLSDSERESVKNREGVKLLEKIREGSYVVALEIEGKLLSSEELSREMAFLMSRGTSHITFVIGGSLGLGDNVKKKSHMSLSFSKMTFPHQLMKLILTEQIYRAFRIMKNEPYHK